MLVSVIIPVYNRAAYLPRLFRSLVQQTYRPLEIVLVDNGSADSSRRLCMAFKEEHHAAGFSVVCLDEAKRGCCACRNKGAQTARGEYLYFFDSDDEMGETFLEEAVSLLPADMVCAPTTMVMPDGRQVNRNAYYTASAADHILTSMLSTQSYIVRKSFSRNVVAGTRPCPAGTTGKWAPASCFLPPACDGSGISTSTASISTPTAFRGRALPAISGRCCKASPP